MVQSPWSIGPNCQTRNLFKLIPGAGFSHRRRDRRSRGRARGLSHRPRGRSGYEASPSKRSFPVVARTRRRERRAIVVTELPYQVNKAGWIEKVAELVNNGRLEGISDLRDESDRTGMRVVIELKAR